MIFDAEGVRARLAAATPGPWRNAPDTAAGRVWVQRGESGVFGPDCEPMFRFRGDKEYARAAADADLIAHAPTDLAAALDRITELEAALAAKSESEQRLHDAGYALGLEVGAAKRGLGSAVFGSGRAPTTPPPSSAATREDR